MARLARDYLAIQAAGVGCERVFSEAGHLYDSQRHYQPNTFSAIMLVNHFDKQQNQDSNFHLDLQSNELITEAELKEELETRHNELMDEMSGHYISEDEELDIHPPPLELRTLEKGKVSTKRTHTSRGSKDSNQQPKAKKPLFTRSVSQQVFTPTRQGHTSTQQQTPTSGESCPSNRHQQSTNSRYESRHDLPLYTQNLAGSLKVTKDISAEDIQM